MINCRGSNVVSTHSSTFGKGERLSCCCQGVSSISDGTYTITTAGQAFSFSESGRVGANNVATSAIDASDGTLDTHTTYGQLTTISGGTKGSLAGTLSATGIPTITAGGQGTTAIGQRTVTLSVFD